MKTNYFLKSVLTLVLLTAGFFSFITKAEAVVIEGVAYDVLNADAKTAQVVKLPGDVKYTGTLTIAATVSINGEDYAVKKIGDGSLRASGDNAASENLTEVIIPEGLEIIGNSSFADCTGITSIQLPASVNSIESWSFYGCSNLATINIPDGITIINGMVFSRCSSLETVIIPASVTKIEAWAFQNAGLKEVYVSWNNQNDVEINYWAFGEDDQRPNYVWKIHYSLADGYDDNWWYRDVKTYALAGDVIVIDGIAYKVVNTETKTAEVVALPDGAKYTGTITIAANITLGTETYSVKKIGDGSLRDAPELTEVIIPEGLEIIGNSSFAGNTGITSLQLPASVNSIEDWAFHGCSNLATINIPDGITAINEHTFQNAGLTSIELPASVKTLKVCAFQDASKLASINLENVRSIDAWSLHGTDIRSVELVDVPLIKSWTFSNCYNLESFIFTSEEVNDFVIEDWALQDINKLKTVVFPNGLKKLNAGVLSGCRALETLTVPNSVTEIKEWSLEKTGLIEISVSWASLEELAIDGNAFGNGTGKSNFAWKISSDLATVYGNTWKGFPVVFDLAEDMVLHAGIAYKILDADAKTAEIVALPTEGEGENEVKPKYTGILNIAASVPFSGKLYAVKKIGNGSLRTSGDNPGSEHLTEVIIPEGLEIIGNSSFADCNEITSIQLPASVNSIEDWAFYGCSGLTLINIPDGITIINAQTFSGAGLTSIELPASVTALKGCAFQNCNKLETINLPESLTLIDAWALAGCSSLDSLVIPNSVTEIKNWALENTGLEKIYVSWINPSEDVTFETWALQNAPNFVWMVTEELADVYGNTWLDHPVRVIGQNGIANISNTSVTWINENQAIRLVSNSNLSGTVDVYSLNGVKVYASNGQINNKVIELPAGIYVIKIASSEGVITGKIHL